MSDEGCQMAMCVNLLSNSCTSFGPGHFTFMLPMQDRVLVFTDHSLMKFTLDGLPCESILLDYPVTDAVMDKTKNIFVAQGDIIKKFSI